MDIWGGGGFPSGKMFFVRGGEWDEKPGWGGCFVLVSQNQKIPKDFFIQKKYCSSPLPRYLFCFFPTKRGAGGCVLGVFGRGGKEKGYVNEKTPRGGGRNRKRGGFFWGGEKGKRGGVSILLYFPARV